MFERSERISSDRFARPDAILALAAALVAVGVYVATLFPGLAGIGDTPKLQFVGRVLGTPHSPGYPLYVMLSWLFARLPIGTVAFRINLMSACFGAVAVGLIALTLRELGCRRSIAFAFALAIAFGRVFWSQAILAEVYTLNAALFAAVLLFLVRWSHTRRESDLVLSLAFFGAGLAHHLTLAMTGPALLLFALAVDPHVITRRIVRAAAIACAAGFGCYALVWLRTRAGAPFLEVRAQSVGDLVAIVSGRQFHHDLFQFKPDVLVENRLPLIARWIKGELQWTGVALAAAAAVFTARERRREAALLFACVVPVALFALNYDVYDVEVFLILPMITLGMAAAMGAEALASRVRPAGAMALAVAIAALLVPAVQYRDNIRVNNQRRHTFEARYFEALFRALPDRTAIVAESYPIDHMVLYKLLGEDAARGRRVEIIPPEPDVVREYARSGFSIFAFVNGRTSLELEGVPFAVAPFPLPKPSPVRHIVDSEVKELAYPLSVVTWTAERAHADPQRPPEPMTGAVWRPVAQ